MIFFFLGMHAILFMFGKQNYLVFICVKSSSKLNNLDDLYLFIGGRLTTGQYYWCLKD